MGLTAFLAPRLILCCSNRAAGERHVVPRGEESCRSVVKRDGRARAFYHQYGTSTLFFRLESAVQKPARSSIRVTHHLHWEKPEGIKMLTQRAGTDKSGLHTRRAGADKRSRVIVN